MPGNKVVVVSDMYREVELEIDDSTFRIDLILIMLEVFDIVISMDWLDKYNDNILCSQKLVRVVNFQGREIIIYGDKRKGDYKVCSVMKARKYLSHGCHAFMAHVIDISFKKKNVKDIPVVNEFLDVFPEDLPGIPPERQVKFRIDLISGATPIAKTPYRLALSEMKELMSQLQELLDKGFICPSSSPWGASILFVKKKDGNMRILKVDPAKIKAVMNWQAPKSVGEIRSFLGLAGYYRSKKKLLKSYERSYVRLQFSFFRKEPKIWSFIAMRLIPASDAFLCNGARSLQYFLEKKDPNMRQRRWLDLLKDYNYEIRYHPDDSRGIKTRQGRIYIPFQSHVKELLLEEAHKSKYSIHPRATKMYLELKRNYWWPGMKRNCIKCVEKCLTCLKVNAEHQKLYGKIQPLEIPIWKWEKITMDFVTKLPRTMEKDDAIWS
ncbi:putative reverse transcriptase domain-containing protein [Tanacetum coccineum]